MKTLDNGFVIGGFIFHYGFSRLLQYFCQSDFFYIFFFKIQDIFEKIDQVYIEG